MYQSSLRYSRVELPRSLSEKRGLLPPRIRRRLVGYPAGLVGEHARRLTLDGPCYGCVASME